MSFGGNPDHDEPVLEDIPVPDRRRIADSLHAACLIAKDDYMYCWSSGDGTHSFEEGVKYDLVGEGVARTCVVDESGVVECWSLYQGDFTVGEEAPPGPAAYRSIAATRYHVLIIDAAGDLTMRNSDESLPVDSSGEKFIEVAALDAGFCAIRESDGGIKCWPLFPDAEPCTLQSADYGELSPPDSNAAYVQIDAGTNHMCALTSKGEVHCWGAGKGGDAAECEHELLGAHHGQSVPPDGQYTYVAAGGFHSCAIRLVDGGIDCWGAGDGTNPCYPDGECEFSEPPDGGGFIQISASNRRTCSFRYREGGDVWEYQAFCWGANDTVAKWLR